ncbi:MAG: alpha/beta fold hydrolase [Sandarakinorhabdus sp.]
MVPPARWAGGIVRMVPVSGGELAVETCGTGPALIMLHGWTLDRRMWLPQLPLAHSFTLVGVDRRGFGQSTASADLAAEPADVLAVADALGLARFHLLGMSQGGRVALALAARAPGRLLSLAFQGTALDGVPSDDEDVPMAAMIAAARRNDLPAVRSLVRGHRLMQLSNPRGNTLAAEILADYDARDLLASGSALAAFANSIVGAAFPVTAIVGMEDTNQRLANARALADAGAATIRLPGAGHICNMDSPDNFNAAIRATAELKLLKFPAKHCVSIQD